MKQCYTTSSDGDIVELLYSAIDSPLSSDLLSCYKANQHMKIVNSSISDLDMSYDISDMGTAAARFRNDYQAQALLSKASFLNVKIDRRKAAIDKWRESEERCSIINSTGRLFTAIPERGPYESLISRARVLIRSALKPFSWNEVYEHSRFSGGASTSHKRSVGHPVRKYQGKPDVTLDCLPLAIAAVRADQQWFYASVLRYGPDPLDWFRIVEGSKMDTVPKSSKIDRVICIEPDMNMMFQKGIGSCIRNRLRAVGINLNSQLLNQQLALIGSHCGSLSTLDLKSASDTISLELVRDLLPSEWFEACMTTRSHVTMIDGELINLEKISSMGNGYTFELESLIFWALSRAVLDHYHIQDRRLAIYGDDIVIHNSAAEPLVQLLLYVGFDTNEDKSYISGPFRESCGKHYFLGRDVTPIYVKDRPSSRDQLFRVCNAFSDWGFQPEVLRSLQKFILPRDRLKVPKRFGLSAGLWEPLLDHPIPRFVNGVWIVTYYASQGKDPDRIRDWSHLHYSLGYSLGRDVNENSRIGGRPVRKRTVTSSWE